MLSPFESVGAPLSRIVPRWAQSGRTKLAVTLYDLIPLIYADHYLVNRSLREGYLTRLELVRQADLVLAISDSTARDAANLLDISPARIAVVGTGVDDRFSPPESRSGALAQAQTTIPGLRSRFAMYTAGFEFRKNINRLLEAYAQLDAALRADHQLVVVCRLSPDHRAQLESECTRLNISDDVLLTGHVSDATLITLYRSTYLFLFPSLYEGFGLPIAEAMACGAPTIAGNNSSLIELVTNDDGRFDSSSPTDIAQAISRALTNPDLRNRLQHAADTASHTWTSVADLTVEACTKLLRNAAPPRPTRPRIAFVSPMPPAQSGVADYSARLVTALTELADVDVDIFAQPGHTELPIDRVTWHDYRAFDVAQASRRYDRVVTAIGNSTYHFEPWRILRAHGGYAMTHDVVLLRFFLAALAERPDLVPTEFGERLAAFGAASPDNLVAGYGSFSAEDYFRYNKIMIEPIVDAAQRIFVHSRYAATLARLAARPGQEDRVQVLPFGLPERPPIGPRPIVTVVSLGIVHTAKQSLKVGQAFALAAKACPDARFALVGDVLEPGLVAALERVVAEADLGERLKVTGRADGEAYLDWLSSATLAVQLRDSSNGETSAAVGDALSAGIPVIASDVGSNLELPVAATVLVSREISASKLADVIIDLVRDVPRAHAMGEAALAYAQENSFHSAARALLRGIGLGNRELARDIQLALK